MIYELTEGVKNKRLVGLTEKILFIVDYENYIRKVLLSKERRAKYYVLGKNEPKAIMYQSARYRWEPFKVTFKGKSTIQYHLYDLALRKRVIANPKTAGKARYEVINGQRLYNGKLAEHTRNKVVKAIGDYFDKQVSKLQPIPIKFFPIRLHCFVYDHFTDDISKQQDWDLFNRFLLYGKVFEDCLVKNKVIPDDNRRYVTQSCSPVYVPIDENQKRKLKFIATQDTRSEIINSEFYKNDI